MHTLTFPANPIRYGADLSVADADYPNHAGKQITEASHTLFAFTDIQVSSFIATQILKNQGISLYLHFTQIIGYGPAKPE